ADERNPRELRTPRALGAPLGVEATELLGELGDAVAQLAAIELQAGLAGAASAGAAPLAPLLLALRRLAEARREVLEADDLHLRLRGTGVRVPVEDVEDDAGAVHDLGAGGLLDVPRLRRRDLVVDEEEVGLARLDAPLQLVELAAPDVGAGIGRRAPLRGEVGADDQAEGLPELPELFEGVGELGVARRGQLDGEEQRAARSFFRLVELHGPRVDTTVAPAWHAGTG